MSGGYFYYFGYGSNMPQARIKARCPSAVLCGVGKLSGWSLKWNNKSQDGSAKCNIETAKGGLVYGAVYTIPRAEIEELQKAEGFNPDRDKNENTYQEEELEIELPETGERVKAKTYIGAKPAEDMQPYDWYWAYIYGGALELELPQNYIQAIQSIECKTDADIGRRKRNEETLREIESQPMIKHGALLRAAKLRP